MTARADGRMASLFLTMPDSLLPTLTRNNRLDLIDFQQNQMAARVKNLFDDDVSLDTLTDTRLCLTLSEASRMEVTLLDSTHLLTLTTVHGRAAESHIALTDTAWRPAPCSAPAYAIADFFRPVPDSLAAQLSATLHEAEALPLISAQYVEADGTLRLALSLAEADHEARLALEPYLREVCFAWGKDGWKKKA